MAVESADVVKMFCLNVKTILRWKAPVGFTHCHRGASNRRDHSWTIPLHILNTKMWRRWCYEFEGRKLPPQLPGYRFEGKRQLAPGPTTNSTSPQVLVAGPIFYVCHCDANVCSLTSSSSAMACTVVNSAGVSYIRQHENCQ